MSRKTYVQSTSNVYYSAPFFIMLTHLVVVVVVFEMFDSKEICLNEKKGNDKRVWHRISFIYDTLTSKLWWRISIKKKEIERNRRERGRKLTRIHHSFTNMRCIYHTHKKMSNDLSISKKDENQIKDNKFKKWATKNALTERNTDEWIMVIGHIKKVIKSTNAWTRSPKQRLNRKKKCSKLNHCTMHFGQTTRRTP